MPGTIAALDFLQSPGDYPVEPVCAVFGNEGWAKHEVLVALREQALDAESREYALSRINGDEAEWRDVMGELSTASLFGGRQLVIVDDADGFVTAHRERLQEYTEHPSPVGVLVLVVGLWASNTKLYKAVDKHGLQVRCGFGKSAAAELRKWIPFLAKRRKLKLAAGAAETLLELVGNELGLLDQQLAKLGNVAQGGKVTSELVAQHCGTWRTQSIFKILDSALDGHTAAALEELDRLLAAGEHPIPILAALTSNLRKFTLATDLIERGEQQRRRVPLMQALRDVKMYGAAEGVERLKKLGRERARLLPAWLQEVDLALKDYSSRDHLARMQLERLLVRISAPELHSARP